MNAEKLARENRNRSGPRTPPDRKWPITPLIEFYGGCGELEQAMSDAGIEVRVTPDRMLKDQTADRWALALGEHPAAFWPSWFDVALTPLDDVFISGGGWRPAWIHQEELRTR